MPFLRNARWFLPLKGSIEAVRAAGTVSRAGVWPTYWSTLGPGNAAQSPAGKSPPPFSRSCVCAPPRLAKLEELLANARLIDESQLDTSKVLVLSTVKLRNQQNGMELTYTLVAESEADLKAGKISVTSPIGKGLLGKKAGETAEIQVPNGTLKFDILEITR